jgi:hypothetical protein
MPITTRQITVTQDEYNIILDALEIFESKVSSKLNKTIHPNKRAKLKELNISIQELITDLGENDTVG